MICDGCGAIIDRSEEYCPNCGMQTSDMRPYPAKNKRYSKKSKTYQKSRPAYKPIKQKYMEKSKPESYDYSQYTGADDYISSDNVYTENNKQKSDIGLMVILLLIALAMGFTVGLIMFTSQLIPSIPGINS